MNKKVKVISAGVLALAAVLSALALPQAHAAKMVDVERKCSMEFQVQNSVYAADAKAEDFAELKDLTIQVHLYQVAAIKETGAYEAADGFEALELEQINDKTSAAQWEEKAAKAKELLEEGVNPLAEKTVTLEQGSGKAENLATGMYLIVADEVQSPYYTYTFKENLISLPNNYYYNGGSDTWVYDLTEKNAVGLKPDREERTGELMIRKTLTSYNETVGGATFVFHVNVEKLDGTVETNVYKMAFAGSGSDSLVIGGMPAGAKVTVTETYSGASYRLVSANDQKVTIIAQEEEGNPVSVSFVNEYNGGHNGGSGIENRFYKDGDSLGWENDLNAEGGDE